MPYIPHTEDDVKQMLDRIGVKNIENLFDEIPASLMYEGFKNIPEGVNEMNMLNDAQKLANKNQNGICFIGAGSYDHHIPAAVWDISSRGEFLTAYTPYQAEASQGSLQLLYEYQTMIAELTGMDVANASLYDGATALAEAALMAVRINKRSKSNRILVAGSIHPLYRQTVETIVRNQHIELTTLSYDEKTGTIDPNQLNQFDEEDITAIIIEQPNFFGCLEQVDELINWAHAHNVISIASVNPISLALLKPPGEWGQHGADIVCGEGQPLGIPMASGGPYFGFFSTKQTFVRQMPGRLIGKTVDLDNKPGYTLTLQAREQHIRRAKATSNICTNQGLMVTAATIHMSLLGAEGLASVAKRCHHNTHALVDALSEINGVRPVFHSAFFHEAVLKLDKPASQVLEALASRGIQGGLAVEAYYPELENCILICATEKRTVEDIETYAKTLHAIINEEGLS
jgi:glycine dehydrogenase subunit 1